MGGKIISAVLLIILPIKLVNIFCPHQNPRNRISKFTLITYGNA